MASDKDTSIQNWRVFLGGFSGGRHKLQVPLPVTKMTFVAVSASEMEANRGTIEEMSAARFVGDADVWVSNISTHGTAGQKDGYVEFVLHVDGIGSEDGIDVMADITRLHAHDSKLDVVSNSDVRRL